MATVVSDARQGVSIAATATRGTNGRELAWASALYFALTLILAWPLPLHPGSTVLWMGADTPLFAWTLAWDVHALTHHPLSIFDANIFHPNRFTLAYSENLIGSAPFAAPAIWFGNNLVLAMNLVSLSACVLCGVGTFLLARRLGIGRAGAVLAGIVFAFSPPRFGRLPQLHLVAVQWIPFALAALHRYLDEGRPRDLRLFAGLFTLQALASGHGAVFLLLASGLLAAWRLALGEAAAPSRRLRDLGIPGLLLLLPAGLIVLPYMNVQEEVGLRRTLDAAWWTDWWPSTVAFIASPSHVDRWIALHLVGLDDLDRAAAFLFPGLLPLALAAVLVFVRRPRTGATGAGAAVSGLAGNRGLAWACTVVLLALSGAAALVLAGYVAFVQRITVRLDSGGLFRVHEAWRPGIASLVLLTPAGTLIAKWWRQAGGGAGVARRLAAWRHANRSNATIFYALLAACGTWLSMGAPLGPWPLLYALPGFNFIRVPARFSILAVLGLALLVGFGFERLARQMGPRRRAAWALVLATAMAGEFGMAPLALAPYTVDIPAVDRWLNTQPKPFIVAEVPCQDDRHLAAYMVHSTAHWQKTIAGYSGIRPRLHEEANAVLRQFPDRASLERLESLGVTYVVVHGGNYWPGQWPAVEARLAEAPASLTLVRAEGLDRVYRLNRHAAPLGDTR